MIQTIYIKEVVSVLPKAQVNYLIPESYKTHICIAPLESVHNSNPHISKLIRNILKIFPLTVIILLKSLSNIVFMYYSLKMLLT